MEATAQNLDRTGSASPVGGEVAARGVRRQPLRPMTEERAAQLREAEAERIEEENEVWIQWGYKDKYHFYMQGEPLCNTTEPKRGFRYINKPAEGRSNRGPAKTLCCPNCLRLNAKRKRDDKRLELLASDAATR